MAENADSTKSDLQKARTPGSREENVKRENAGMRIRGGGFNTPSGNQKDGPYIQSGSESFRQEKLIFDK
jgi:hypothetical protein